MRWVGVVFFIALWWFALLQDTVEAQAQKVRISISSRSNTSVPFYVAASKGFFREEGMDVEIIQANPRLGVMALMNGDVAFTGTFVSTVRGILSGFPLKIVLVAFKRGVYYLIAHPSVKDIHDLKGKKLGVSSIRGSDHLVAEELLRSKGFNPAQLQPVALGDTSVRFTVRAHGRRGSDCAVAAARFDGAAIRRQSARRTAGDRHAGVRDDYVGSFD